MKENKKIYITGHKNPDTDSICSPLAYADFLRQNGKKAEAVRTGKINPETKFVLDYFKIKAPKLITNVKGKQIILLDHNEKTQSPDDIEKANILEVIDHHKILFKWPEPILFHSEPVGCTGTLIAEKYFNDRKVKLSKQMAGILLSAVLSDTVVFRSPTTTKKDKEIAKKLAKIVKIKNLDKFGIEIKKQKASFKGLNAKNILFSDFKIFNFSGKKVGVGQVEVCDFKEANERKEEFVKKFKEILKKEKYNLLILMVTDIIKIGSQLLTVGQTDYVEKALGKKVKGNSVYLKGVMSRKKQVVPPLERVFSK